MRKIRVNLILVLVIIALGALFIIQAFQTGQLYDKKSTQFKSRVHTALERIALRHEKAEDFRKIMHLDINDFSGQYKAILKEEFQNLLSAQESINIRDTAIFENGSFQNYLIIKGTSLDSVSGVVAEHKVLARDVRQLRELFNRKSGLPDEDSLQLAIQLDQRVLQQIFKKARFVNEMMLETFKDNVYQQPSDRIDVQFLDSIIGHELSDDDLPQDYEFVITNEYGQAINFAHLLEHYKSELDSSQCQSTVLFPSNVIDSDLRLNLYFPNKQGFLFSEMWGPLVVNFLLMLVVLLAIVFMFRTILTQKKLAELKNDFISNMTHEFKTPISTISLACQALNDKDMNSSSALVSPYVKMINDENSRLGVLVERILQSAILDKGEVKLKKERVMINELVYEIAEKAALRIKARDGKLEVDCPTELMEIEADRVHLTNVLSNLVDNGIKYSPEQPDIKIIVEKANDLLKISVEDKGLGIKKEHLKKIFDKLYRIPTGNVHDVKGFGLGLSYVKAICDLHLWQINVKSTHGEGSLFTVEIPYRK